MTNQSTAKTMRRGVLSMKKKLILLVILMAALAGCAKEYPHALDDPGDFSEVMDDLPGISLYQLANEEVALVQVHEVDEEKAYSVSILDADKAMVASYSVKAESDLEALAFRQDPAGVDKHFGGQSGFVALDKVTRQQIYDSLQKNYKGQDAYETQYLRDIVTQETVFASPEYFNGQDFRLHVYRVFMIPLSTIYVSVEGDEYHFTSVMDGCW